MPMAAEDRLDLWRIHSLVARDSTSPDGAKERPILRHALTRRPPSPTTPGYLSPPEGQQGNPRPRLRWPGSTVSNLADSGDRFDPPWPALFSGQRERRLFARAGPISILHRPCWRFDSLADKLMSPPEGPEGVDRI
jgi:hypothetical protein